MLKIARIMRSFDWMVTVVVLTVHVNCQSATVKPVIIARNVSCTVNVTDIQMIKSSCDNETLYLVFKDSHFDLFPRVFELFPQLRSIDVSNAGIKHIESTTFDGAHQLTSLDMDGSNMPTLQNSLFTHVNNLTSFDMTKSNIVTIEKNAFHGLSNLKRLDLSNNKIVGLDAGTFQPLSLLETIRLSNNKIEVISEDLFKNNVHLRSAYFSSNDIIAVDANSFIHCQLIDLDLGFNQLRDLDMTTMKYLKTLIVESNKLEILRIPSVVVEVHAENNSITAIDSDETNELVRLFLSTNYFSNFRNLANLKKLEFLDLANNHFRNVEFSDLKSLTLLRELKLCGNKIAEIKVDDVVTNLPKLAMIELSTKHWRDDYIDQLKIDLKNHSIVLGQDRTIISDDVPATTIRPSISTQTPNTGDIESRLNEIGRQLKDLENRMMSTAAANSKKYDDRLNDMQSDVNDRIVKSNAANNAKIDAMMSTFKLYEAFVIIMLLSCLSFVLYKLVVYGKNALSGMRYRRAQSSDPIFSEQDL